MCYLGGPSYQAPVQMDLVANICCVAVCYHIMFVERLGVGPMFRVRSTRLVLPTDPLDLLCVFSVSLCIAGFVYCVE